MDNAGNPEDSLTIESASAVLERVISHYAQLRDRFRYKYPSAGAVGQYFWSDNHQESAEALTADVHPSLTDLLHRLQSDKLAIAAACIGDNFIDLQKSSMQSPRGPSRNFPFCYRVDAVWDGKRFRILEVNTDNVGGIEDSFSLRCLYRSMSDPYAVPRLPACTLASRLKQLHPKGAGRIVYTDGVCEVAANRLVWILNALGTACCSTHINDLASDPINYSWIYRDFMFEDLFIPVRNDPVLPPDAESVKYFLSLCRDGRVPVYNTMASCLISDKRWLCQENLKGKISSSSIKRFLKHVMLTKPFDKSAVTPDGKVREGIVVKPGGGSGGNGIRMPGDLCSKNLVDHVMQDFIKPEQCFLMFPGGWKRQVNVIHGLYIVDGVFAGDHIRASPSLVVNVASGGAMIPALPSSYSGIVEEELHE